MLEEAGRVLWIDDAVSELSAEVRLLHLEGFEVDCASSGEAGFALLARHSYGAVLLDLRLGDESGLDVLQRLVERRVTAPIVMLTGYAELGSAVTAIKLGAEDFWSKPLNVDEIAPLLRALVSRRGERPPREAPLTEIEWLEIQCDRLDECLSRAEMGTVITGIVLDDRLTLPSFVGCVAALQFALTTTEPSLTIAAGRMRQMILSAARAPRPQHPKVRQAFSALERGETREAPGRLAGRMGLSRAYFGRMILRETGRHTSEWCRAAVLRTAFRELLQTAEQVTQIAYAAGYEHPSQFDRDFRVMFGVSPTALRRLIARREAADG